MTASPADGHANDLATTGFPSFDELIGKPSKQAATPSVATPRAAPPSESSKQAPRVAAPPNHGDPADSAPSGASVSIFAQVTPEAPRHPEEHDPHEVAVPPPSARPAPDLAMISGGGRQDARTPAMASPDTRPGGITVPEAVPGGGEPPVAGGRRPWALRLDVDAVNRVLWVSMAVVVICDFLASAAAGLHAAPYSITRFLDGDEKVNVPTGFKTTSLLAATLLLLALWSVATRDHDRAGPGWRLLAAISAFAFFDETTYLHQSLATVVHEHLHTSGVLTYAWTIVYVPVLAAAGLLVLRYARHIPSPLRWRLVAGGGLYGFGAVALEPVKSTMSEHYGDGSLNFKLTAAVSDSLEMVGLTILLVSLIAGLATMVSVLNVEVTPNGTA
jgi:hypothetical protein